MGAGFFLAPMPETGGVSPHLPNIENRPTLNYIRFGVFYWTQML
jgi:hypothetical protein